MLKLTTVLFYTFICLTTGVAHAALQGKWNVTELVTVKTIWDKQTQVQGTKKSNHFYI